MCTDFGGKFVNRNCETILNSFYEYMKDNQNPKLQAHATKCIVNFCEKASKKLFMKNLKNIVQALFELTQSTQVPFVQVNNNPIVFLFFFSQNQKLQAQPIVNFCEKASKTLFMKNLKNIVQAFFELTQSTQVPFVQVNNNPIAFFCFFFLQNPKLQDQCIVNFCEKASTNFFIKNFKNIVQALF
jgi:hypothetical protein